MNRGTIKQSIFFSFLATGARGFSSTAAPTKNKLKQIVKTESVPGLKNGMDYVKLGDSDLVVSNICMGTMTFGSQNTLEEGVEQLATAFGEYGVNFIDTAGKLSSTRNAGMRWNVSTCFFSCATF